MGNSFGPPGGAHGFGFGPVSGTVPRGSVVKKSVFSEDFGWESIGTAPVEQDVSG
jgi:hypothetical protein